MPESKADTFVGEIQSRLDDLKREFLDLELEQMRKGEIAARQELEKVKKSVATRRQELEKRLSDARSASGAALGDLQEGVTSAWSELREAVDAARDTFRGEVSDS